jgi:hypothetical protein
MEIYRFMHYIFGIKVKENPSPNTRLSVEVAQKTIDLPTKRTTTYGKGLLKNHLKEVLDGLSTWGWSFDLTTRTFVFKQP